MEKRRPALEVFDPDDVYQAIVARVPQLYEVQDEMLGPLNGFLAGLHGTREPTPAEHATFFIATQATNDFLDLLADCSHGRGRPCLRAARSLFELLVTARDVWASQPEAERYLDHAVVGDRIAASLRLETELLSGKERQADEHRRKKVLRDTAGRHATAIQKYGPSFEARWASRDLRSRATSHGLADDYDAYRLASIILHGAAGGVIGLHKEIRGSLIYRVGPAFSIAPLGLLLGIRWFDQLVAFVGPRMAEDPATELRASFRALRQAWPEYRRALMDLDRQLWPDPPPAPPVALLAIIPATGKEQWFVYNIEVSDLYPADPPKTIPPLIRRGIDEVKQQVKREVPTSTEWITVAVPAVTVRPAKGAKTKPAELVLLKPPPRGWPESPPSPENPKTWLVSGLTSKERKAAFRKRRDT